MAETIPMLVAHAPNISADGSKSVFGHTADGERVVQVPLATLKHNIAAVTNTFLGALGGLQQVGEFKLKEVTVKLEVSAEGGVSLVGTAKAQAKGAIELKFSGS